MNIPFELSHIYDLKALLQGVPDKTFVQVPQGQVDYDVAFGVDTLFETFRCETSGIPDDPRDWSSDDVCRWLNWVYLKFNLVDLQLEHFLDSFGQVIDGRALCKLTKRNLCFKTSAVTGEILWKSLQTICAEYNKTQELLRQAVHLEPSVVVQESSIDLTDVLVSTTVQNADEFLAKLTRSPSPDPSETSDYGSMSSLSPSSFEDLSPASSPGQPSSPTPEVVPSPPPRTSGRKRGPKPLVRYNGNGPIQLWQFLLELLLSEEHTSDVGWTHEEVYEFKLLDPENVAKMWGKRKNKPKMNYEKLSRGLRYYYDKNIISKVHGKRYVYRFLCDIESVLGYNPTESLQEEVPAEDKVPASPVGSLKSETLSVEDPDTFSCSDSLFGDDLATLDFDDMVLEGLNAVMQDDDFGGLVETA